MLTGYPKLSPRLTENKSMKPITSWCHWLLKPFSLLEISIKTYVLLDGPVFDWRMSCKKKQKKTTLLNNFLDSNPLQKRTLSPPGSQLNFALSRDICAGQISQPGISITYAENRGRMPMIILQACVDGVTLSVTVFMVACGWEMCAEVFCHFKTPTYAFIFYSCCCLVFFCLVGGGMAHAKCKTNFPNLNHTGQLGQPLQCCCRTWF